MRKYFLYSPGAGGEGNGSGGGLIGQATQEQINEWKAKHPLGIYAIQVGGHVAYFKNPGFDELNYGYAQWEADKALAMWLAIAGATKIGGSEEVLTNPTLFSGAKGKIQQKVDGAKAELLDL
jgi:hypothetical protein